MGIIYTADIVVGTGIVYLCTKQVVDGGSGLLSNLVCRRRRLPPLLVVASCGDRCSQGVPCVFLKKQDVFILCHRAALIIVFICVYSGDLCDYEIDLSL